MIELAVSPPKKAGLGNPVKEKRVSTPLQPIKTTGSGSVFDRLTNVNSYTGAHKHRFNNDGTGRGLAGRDSPDKQSVGKYRGGNVRELAQILRN
jgi:hypothetical protein